MGPGERSLLVLVVDDEPAMVGAVSALVGRAGHRVVTAYDGNTALRRFSEERPDLVLLDLAMPGLDGVEVCRAIRRMSQTPIIVLTGEADERAKVEALDTGADDYVVKPFGKQELLARIRAVMRRRGNEAEPHGVGELRWGAIVLDRGRHTAAVSGEEIILTRTEYSLLASLVAAAGHVVSHSTLLSAGWPGRTQSRSAVAQAPPRPPALEARGSRRAGPGLGPRRRLPPRRGRLVGRTNSSLRRWIAADTTLAGRRRATAPDAARLPRAISASPGISEPALPAERRAGRSRNDGRLSGRAGLGGSRNSTRKPSVPVEKIYSATFARDGATSQATTRTAKAMKAAATISRLLRLNHGTPRPARVRKSTGRPDQNQ